METTDSGSAIRMPRVGAGTLFKCLDASRLMALKTFHCNRRDLFD
jgi:hypothetical protein